MVKASTPPKKIDRFPEVNTPSEREEILHLKMVLLSSVAESGVALLCVAGPDG
jgi:hypothetical protein